MIKDQILNKIIFKESVGKIIRVLLELLGLDDLLVSRAGSRLLSVLDLLFCVPSASSIVLLSLLRLIKELSSVSSVLVASWLRLRLD